jgi:hypothetical protein
MPSKPQVTVSIEKLLQAMSNADDTQSATMNTVSAV